ncbi:MAG: phosphoribosylglycinamide formyltransferase [Marinicellaceae bacterium]
MAQAHILNIAVFISGTGSNLAAVIDKQQKYGYRVSLVISNKKNAIGLQHAHKNNIPVYTFTWDQQDSELLHLKNTINAHQCDLLVLAGFMKILPAPFIRYFANKIINIHPSLLPKYPGLNTHQRVIDNQDKQHGATVHFVNAQLDAGKIISQSIIEVENTVDVKSLANKLLFREHSLLPRTIALFAQNRVEWKDNMLFFEHQPLTKPIIIND